MTKSIYFKVLNEDGTVCHGGTGKWPLPNGGPGDPLTVKGKLIPCQNGLHLCREQDLVLWLGPAIYVAQYQGGRIDDTDKIVVRRARLLQRLDTWNERVARLFACDCAERALALLKKPDQRSVHAVAVARLFANNEATCKDLDAAWDAAGAAAWYPAGYAAWYAAGYTARDAAWYAAGAAAGYTARDAAWYAAGAAAQAAAGYAAQAAAGDAAWYAAWDAAGAAAWRAERKWQTQRLLQYLRGET